MLAPFSCEENGIRQSLRGYSIRRNALKQKSSLRIQHHRDEQQG